MKELKKEFKIVEKKADYYLGLKIERSPENKSLRALLLGKQKIGAGGYPAFKKLKIKQKSVGENSKTAPTRGQTVFKIILKM